MVEAPERHKRWFTTASTETELEEAGSRRLLAAVDEPSEPTSHLKRMREQLWASLPALSKNRAEKYRLNSDALTLARSGTTYQDPRKMAGLSEDEIAAHEAMRGVQREIRELDDEIGKNGRTS